jgi:hypothetical protein
MVGSGMATTVAKALPAAHHKPLRMSGEPDPKALRNADFRRVIGRAIETALAASGMEKKAAARDMGYGDNQASLSNWISGNETPQFAKLWTLGPRFRQELVIALAAECEVGVTVRTVIDLERRRA